MATGTTVLTIITSTASALLAPSTLPTANYSIGSNILSHYEVNIIPAKITGGVLSGVSISSKSISYVSTTPMVEYEPLVTMKFITKKVKLRIGKVSPMIFKSVEDSRGFIS